MQKLWGGIANQSLIRLHHIYYKVITFISIRLLLSRLTSAPDQWHLTASGTQSRGQCINDRTVSEHQSKRAKIRDTCQVACCDALKSDIQDEINPFLYSRPVGGSVFCKSVPPVIITASQKEKRLQPCRSHQPPTCPGTEMWRQVMIPLRSGLYLRLFVCLFGNRERWGIKADREKLSAIFAWL